jgi:hypothetical protein
VERLFGTLQDRLVNGLAHHGVTNMADANVFLAGFIPRFNAHFQHQAADPTLAFSAGVPMPGPRVTCDYTTTAL